MTESDHIVQLRQQVANLHGLLVKAKAERDEARRELCLSNSTCSYAIKCGAREYATERGWDCFKENP